MRVQGKQERPLARAVVSTLVAVSCAMAAQAASKDAPPRTPGELLERALKPIFAHVRNIQVKIEGGIGRVGRGEAARAQDVTGWAAACCARNIVQLREKLDTLEKAVLRLLELYRKQERGDGVRLANSLVNETRRMRQRLEAFARAGDAKAARQAYEQLRASAFALQRDRRDLVACCNDVPL